jgi:hypothetical protein
MWMLIVVAAHVRSRDEVAYPADLEQMWVEISSVRGLLLQTMLVDLLHASFCPLYVVAVFPGDSMQRSTRNSSMDM